MFWFAGWREGRLFDVIFIIQALFFCFILSIFDFDGLLFEGCPLTIKGLMEPCASGNMIGAKLKFNENDIIFPHEYRYFEWNNNKQNGIK